MARVELTDDAKNDIRRLDGSVRTRVLKDLQKLKTAPADRGAPLRARDTSNLTGLRKLRVGPKKAYRAVFAADGDTLAVVVVVAARSESQCHELALARLRLLADSAQRTELTNLLTAIMGR
ncbi:type II toxin-antitoxin system RelE/ParE family toxin [Mycobacterium sp. M1]|uniref:Type II toxin-antitoxin system RelE/ParE family toxin n=1 Tax=Mycolicibacter acidiphilus TaxID=2835306 RepID=A0ABS5RNR7_9MYCO|nr:type II toxin-antitoxin system RelE/ParE family toxin [Mycolicibacter acidiphilus]MBS9535829.1 type II toxin-antitoxin system RelE/ParE family toxin [Mycolicibacter acidiphilus]